MTQPAARRATPRYSACPIACSAKPVLTGVTRRHAQIHTPGRLAGQGWGDPSTFLRPNVLRGLGEGRLLWRQSL
jgi:hypothetical protein